MPILMTPEGKKVVTSREDVELYDAPHNPPNTGTAFLSGTDLRVHKARSGNLYYYTYHWSMWQGSSDYYELVSEDEAKAFILEKETSHSYHERNGVNSDAVMNLWGSNFFDEDA